MLDCDLVEIINLNQKSMFVFKLMILIQNVCIYNIFILFYIVMEVNGGAVTLNTFWWKQKLL